MPIAPDRIRHPEKRNRPDSPIQRKPAWIRVKAPVSKEYHETRQLMRTLKLNTVCEEAACPNIGECWAKGHATVMILGSVCTSAPARFATWPPAGRTNSTPMSPNMWPRPAPGWG